MNCSTAPDRPSSENISPEETAGAVANGVGQLDLDRASAYAGLTSLRSGQSEAYAREEKLLARKYGEQHPRVLAVAQRRAANEVFLRDLAVAHALAATPPPQTDASTYIFHGHIRDCDRKPLPQLTVGLYSARGEYLSSLGYGCSDEDGYFLLRGTPPPSADGAETIATIRVYDANQKLLHTECEPLRVAPGRSDYREIIICDDVCPPPPGDPGDPPPAPLTVPDVVGKKEAAAKAQLERAGFAVESLTRAAEDANAGLVLEQRPPGGSKAAHGTVVTIVIGTALPKVEVPDVVGRSLREAQAILANASLTTGNIQPAGASLQSPVVQQAPAAGAQVTSGSAVDLVVRPPVEKIIVPQLIRRSLGEAKRMILDTGLTVGKIQPAGASDTNIVTDQAPAAGTEVDRGTTVDLAVAENPKATVPKVVGLKLAEAKQVLERARLTVGKINPPDAVPSSVVAKQSPEAGSLAAEGSAVDLELRSPTRGSTAAPKARPVKKAAPKKKPRQKHSKKRGRQSIDRQ
jgi:beta-lactam-binding protein with PASTA domain